MIRLSHLLTEVNKEFTAKSKDSGKLVHFKSKESYEKAIKAGSHEDPTAKTSKGDDKKGGVNIFNTPSKEEPKKTQGKLSKFIYGDDDKKPDVVAKPEGKPDLSKYSTADEDWFTKDAASISTIYNDKLTIDDLQNVFKAKGYGDVTDTTLDDIVDRYNDEKDVRDRFKDNGISKGKLTNRIKDLKAQLKSGGTKSEPTKLKYYKDGKMTQDSADSIEKELNAELGVSGMADINSDTGTIEYFISDDSDEAIFIGKEEGGKGIAVSFGDGGDEYKTFKHSKDAIAYAKELGNQLKG